MGVDVHGNHESRRSPARLSRFAAAGVVWNPWPSSPEDAVERLIRWAAGRPEPSVLIPVDDAAALAVADHADVLASSFVFPRLGADLVRSLSDKLELAELCAAHSIPTPHVAAPKTLEEAEALAGTTDFPVVLKRIANWGSGDHSLQSVRIVSDSSELIRLWRELAPADAGNFLLQEFIPGSSKDVWMFNGYFDEESRCLASFTGIKLRQYPQGRGSTTLGECRSNAEVARLAIALLGGLGYRGIVDMGFRLDHRDGSYKLLDVNTRIGSTFRLFVGARGTDVIRALYLDLTGERVAPDAAVDGRRWMVEPSDFLSAVKEHELLGWPRSLRSAAELAWFARDDPRPAAALAMTLPRLAVSRARAT